MEGGEAATLASGLAGVAATETGFVTRALFVATLLFSLVSATAFFTLLVTDVLLASTLVVALS